MKKGVAIGVVFIILMFLIALAVLLTVFMTAEGGLERPQVVYLTSSKGVTFFDLETTGGKIFVIVVFLIALAFFLLFFRENIQTMIEETTGELLDADWFMG